MKRMILVTALAALTATPAGAADLAGGTLVQGKPMVIDGDTILVEPTVGEAVRVRLFGIDAPEMETIEGWAAKMALDAIVGQGMITCRVVVTDRYKRAVSTCTTGDGIDPAQEMLLQGMATTYRTFLHGSPQEIGYRVAEREAWKKFRGLYATLSR